MPSCGRGFDGHRRQTFTKKKTPDPKRGWGRPCPVTGRRCSERRCSEPKFTGTLIVTLEILICQEKSGKARAEFSIRLSRENPAGNSPADGGSSIAVVRNGIVHGQQAVENFSDIRNELPAPIPSIPDQVFKRFPSPLKGIASASFPRFDPRSPGRRVGGWACRFADLRGRHGLSSRLN